MNILVSGATGFIGSHTCVSLLEEGHNVIAFDNFFNILASLKLNKKGYLGEVTLFMLFMLEVLSAYKSILYCLFLL